MRRQRAAFAVLLCLASSSCDAASPDAVASLQQIRRQADGQPMCAPLIAGVWPIEASRQALSAPSIEVLIEEGLFILEPLPGVPGDQPHARLVPTRTGSKALQLRTFKPSIIVAPLLCYGRVQVQSVSTEMVGSAVAPENKDTSRLSYTFRVVDTPTWVDQRTRAAFPFLARAIGPALQSRDYAFLENGAWRLQHPPNENTVGQLDGKGFFACPVPDPRPHSPCR